MKWFKLALSKYAEFSGRSRRSEYWYFVLFNFLFAIAAAVIDIFVTGSMILYPLYSLAMIIPGLAVAVRRLHDTGKTGWWLLIAVVPLIGAIVLLVFMATEGDPRENRYGADPKSQYEEDHISQHLV